jgi:hypothetical protein
VESTQGMDVVTIPGGTVMAEDYQPEVPVYPVFITVPLNYRVQDVQLTSRSGLYTTQGLSLPIAVPITDGLALDGMQLATALSAAGLEGARSQASAAESGEDGWYPGQDLEWHVQPEGDGTSSLVLRLYPFQYNALTTDVRFYQDYALAIRYTTPGVTLTHLSTEKPVYQPGETVMVNIGLIGGGAPQDVVVEASIHRYDDGARVDGLLLRTLPALTGPAEFTPQWDSSGRPAGEYYVQLTLRDGSGELLDEYTCSFHLGTLAAEVTMLSAAPDRFQIGASVDIVLEVRNSGTVNLSGVAVVQVLRAGEVVATLLEAPFADLAPGATGHWNATWDSSGSSPGAYTILGSAQYASSAASAAVQITALGGAKVYLPLVIRSH